jgi:hypothetical protein
MTEELAEVAVSQAVDDSCTVVEWVVQFAILLHATQVTIKGHRKK